MYDLKTGVFSHYNSSITLTLCSTLIVINTIVSCSLNNTSIRGFSYSKYPVFFHFCWNQFCGSFNPTFFQKQIMNHLSPLMIILLLLLVLWSFTMRIQDSSSDTMMGYRPLSLRKRFNSINYDSPIIQYQLFVKLVILMIRIKHTKYIEAKKKPDNSHSQRRGRIDFSVIPSDSSRWLWLSDYCNYNNRRRSKVLSKSSYLVDEDYQEHYLPAQVVPAVLQCSFYCLLTISSYSRIL